MKPIYRTSLLSFIAAAAVFTSGCTAEQVDAVQPIVNTLNEGLNPNSLAADPDLDPEVEVLNDPATGTAVLEATGIVTEVAIGEIEGVFFAGLPPESLGSINLDPLVVDSQPVQFISGGSTQVPLQSDTPFVTAYIAADSEGYFQIDLPNAVTTADLIITFSTIQLNGEVGDIDVQVGSATGDVSGAQELPVTSVVVGTGDLQVSVSWNTPADVDLYLQEPSGETIFFGNSESETGGILDLDSNVGCPENEPQNENITYENVVPPSGEYTVALRLFSTCGVVTTDTDYVVTVRVGNDIQTYTGTFLADSSNRDALITTFEVR